MARLWLRGFPTWTQASLSIANHFLIIGLASDLLLASGRLFLRKLLSMAWVSDGKGDQMDGIEKLDYGYRWNNLTLACKQFEDGCLDFDQPSHPTMNISCRVLLSINPNTRAWRVHDDPGQLLHDEIAAAPPRTLLPPSEHALMVHRKIPSRENWKLFLVIASFFCSCWQQNEKKSFFSAA